ncbi:ribonuclease J [Bacillus fonticola]|uniref:ribonuclease J n=1 Tax=Bacillus fonticola TaxID=2728853 RepID=UPI001472EACD|nr:ribonuclease J [Bacillus fonticola]
MNKLTKTAVRVIPLGGVEERENHLTLLEVDEDVFILDSGQLRPEQEMLGVDRVIPDLTPIVERSQRVKGIFLTKADPAHFGALPILLQVIHTKVFATKETIQQAKRWCQEHEVPVRSNTFQEVTSGDVFQVGNTKIRPFATSTLTIGSCGYGFHTDEGWVVYTGTMSLQPGEKAPFRTDMRVLQQLGAERVRLLLPETIGLTNTGPKRTYSSVTAQLENWVEQAEQTVLATIHEQDTKRIFQLLEVANRVGRKVTFHGKRTSAFVKGLFQYNPQWKDEGYVVPPQKAKLLPSDAVLHVFVGREEEPYEALRKWTNRLQQGDVVLLLTHWLWGREVQLSRYVNELYRKDVDVHSLVKSTRGEEQTSRGELEWLLEFLQPAQCIPLGGEYQMLLACQSLWERQQKEPSHAALPEKGDILLCDGQKGIEREGTVTKGHVFIDGKGVGDIGQVVLRDRKWLSEDGVVSIVIPLHSRTKLLAAQPQCVTRGFVYKKQSAALLERITNVVAELVEAQSPIYDWADLKQKVKDVVQKELFDATKRRPVILPIIVEIRQ